jgi:hypothetical protein
MDISQDFDIEFIAVEDVERSPTKRCVVIGEGGRDQKEKFAQVYVEVELDGEQRKLRLNLATIRSCKEWGLDTSHWIGRVLDLHILKMFNGGSYVAARPAPKPVKPVRQPAECVPRPTAVRYHYQGLKEEEFK